MAKFFNRLFKGAIEKRSLGTSAYNLRAYANQVDYGVVVTEQTALNFTAYYGGCKLIADNIASLPVHIHKFKKGGWQEDTASPAYYLLNVKPNHWQNPFEFKFQVLFIGESFGRSYVLVKRDESGKPNELIPIHPDWITKRTVGSKIYYTISAANAFYLEYNGTYPQSEIIEFKILTLDGINPESPVLMNAAAIGEGLAAQKFAGEYYKKGGNMKGVITNDRILAPEEYERFSKHFSDSTKNFDTPILDAGYKYQQLSINPVVAQLLSEKTFSIDDIARILSIPPHLLMELSHATFSNIEQENIEFVTMTLRPLCQRLEAELESKLFFDDEKSKYQIDFDLDGLLRGDTAARSAFYHQLLQDCVMTPNEVRDKEHLERQEGLDFFMQPLNMNRINPTTGEIIQTDNK